MPPRTGLCPLDAGPIDLPCNFQRTWYPEELLQKIGYDTSNIEAATWAFMRHYMAGSIPTDTAENLLSKPYPDTLKTDDLLTKTLKSVLFEIQK